MMEYKPTKRCLSHSSDGLQCTRSAGHPGNHEQGDVSWGLFDNDADDGLDLSVEVQRVTRELVEARNEWVDANVAIDQLVDARWLDVGGEPIVGSPSALPKEMRVAVARWRRAREMRALLAAELSALALAASVPGPRR